MPWTAGGRGFVVSMPPVETTIGSNQRCWRRRASASAKVAAGSGPAPRWTQADIAAATTPDRDAMVGPPTLRPGMPPPVMGPAVMPPPVTPVLPTPDLSAPAGEEAAPPA